MHHWVYAQTQAPPANILDAFLKLLIDNPSLAVLALALLIMYLASRSVRDDLKASRNIQTSIQVMMTDMQKAGDASENKALGMAENAINKFDRLADSITDMANAQLEASTNYFASAQKIADAHVETTTMLVNRIAAMEDKRSEDEIYSNESLKRQIDEQRHSTNRTSANWSAPS